VTVRRPIWLAAVGLCLTQLPHGRAADPTPAEPVRLAPVPGTSRSANQQVADAIAATLRQSGQLHGYTIDVAFQGGTAELSGQVADQPQREEALRITQGVPGVERVRDRLTLAGAVVPVVAQAGQPPVAPPELPKLPPPVREGGPAADANAPPAGAPGAPGQPVPIFQAPPGVPYALNPPKMPPYAWPTYAPYNNYARVAYPQAYPYNAFPFIGPIYPFPKVPLGWRVVKLEWEDGYWWFSKVGNKYDWWRLKYR
jgi:hypothetical protein